MEADGRHGASSQPHGDADPAPAQLAQLAAALGGLPDAALVIDARGDVVSLNGAAERLLSGRGAALVGRPAAELGVVLGARTRQPVEDLVARALRGALNECGLVLIDRQGVERPVAISGGPIRGRDGEVVAAALLLREVEPGGGGPA